MEFVDGVVAASSVPEPLDTPEERAPDERGARRRARGDARRRLARGRPRGLRQADRLPRAPGAALQRAVGAQPHARAAGRRARRPRGCATTCRSPATRPSSTATSGSATSCSRPRRRRGWSAIVDWEMSTIGDPLADLGYLTTFWFERDDPPSGLPAGEITRAEGFFTRDEILARYEERSGRSMSDARWYQVLALWKIIVFMEGNYKRAVAGSTDDPYLKSFGDIIVELGGARRGCHAWVSSTARSRSSPAARTASGWRRHAPSRTAGAAVVIADVNEDGGRRAARGGRRPLRRHRHLGPRRQPRDGGLRRAHLRRPGPRPPQRRHLVDTAPGPDFDLARYRRAMGVNLDGVVFGTQAALPALRERGGGALVATSSLAGLMGVPMDPIYCANKHAVVGFTRAMAECWPARASASTPSARASPSRRSSRRSASSWSPPASRSSRPSRSPTPCSGCSPAT